MIISHSAQVTTVETRISCLRKRLRSGFRVSSIIWRTGDERSDTTMRRCAAQQTKLDYRPGCNSAVTFITRAIVAVGLHAAVLTRSLSHGEWSHPRSASTSLHCVTPCMIPFARFCTDTTATV